MRKKDGHAVRRICAALGKIERQGYDGRPLGDRGTPSTDHSREYIPFLALGAGVAPGNLGTLCGFDRIGRAAERLLCGGMERFAL